MAELSERSCAYVRSDGTRCPGPVDGSGDLCFWHDKGSSKEGPDVRPRLEAWAESGESMEGFVLRYANLEHVRLVARTGRVLQRAHLFRANLQGASLWNVDLREADLTKANLAGANLNEARLQGADLLGANLDGTRLERVQWGDRCTNEKAAATAEREGRHADARAKYEEAEEVYRTLRRSYDAAGRFEQAGAFFRREMTMRRKLMPKWSGGRAWSKLVDLLCAYGESPPRVIVSAVVLNLLAAFAFFALGIRSPDGPCGFDASLGLWANVEVYLNCLYFSLITFLTVGYGDFLPLDLLTRHLASTHAFIGSFMMALFVAVFGKKMTRG